MSYTLRLFENDKEVSTSTVETVSLGAQNYPDVGQVIDEKWQITDVLSHTESEVRLRVKRVGHL
jgi:hypothetical protein